MGGQARTMEDSIKIGIAVAVLLTLISWVFVIYMAWKSFRVERDIPAKMTIEQLEHLLRRTPRQKVGVVSEINIYPVKSTAQVRVSGSEVTHHGLEHDRRFMITDAESGTFVS